MATMCFEPVQRFILAKKKSLGHFKLCHSLLRDYRKHQEIAMIQRPLVSSKLSANPLHSKKAVHENNKLLFPLASAAHYGFSVNTLSDHRKKNQLMIACSQSDNKGWTNNNIQMQINAVRHAAIFWLIESSLKTNATSTCPHKNPYHLLHCPCARKHQLVH